MNYKKRCIIGGIAGIVLVVIGVLCAMLGTGAFRPLITSNSPAGVRKFLITLAFIFVIAGGFFGRISIKGLIRVAVFNRAKAKELEKLEAMFSCGGISQEEYYAQKIQLLNAEYGDR